MNEIEKAIQYCEKRYRIAIMDESGDVFFPYKSALEALREQADRSNGWGATSGYYTSIEDAISAWNRRTRPKNKPSEVPNEHS